MTASDPDGAVPAGPHFVYEVAPDLFLGRRGQGALEVVWDTNILSDYLEHGADLWEGRELGPDLPYTEELEALGLLVSLWAIRDIRIHILPLSVDDAKKRLTDERRTARVTALNELASALALDLYDDDATEQKATALNPDAGARADALARLPDGMDRDLVDAALELGAHVFLTRDKAVLRCTEDFKELGLLIASPLDLIEELAACGAILCLIQPAYAYWPAPDLQRVAHLVQALGADA